MHSKILIAGDDQMTLVADSMLLKDQGIYVYTATNLNNIPELVAEIKPDAIFFDTVNMADEIKTAYDSLVNNNSLKDIPVIYTLAEDELYLIIPKRTRGWRKKYTADNVIDAVKMALKNYIPDLSKCYITRQKSQNSQAQQLQLAINVV